MSLPTTATCPWKVGDKVYKAEDRLNALGEPIITVAEVKRVAIGYVVIRWPNHFAHICVDEIDKWPWRLTEEEACKSAGQKLIRQASVLEAQAKDLRNEAARFLAPWCRSRVA